MPADTRSAKRTVRPRRASTSAANRKARSLEEQGLGWKNSFASGKGDDAITSGIEVTWTTNPVKWDNNFLENLHGYEWELEKSPWRCEPVDSQECIRRGHRAAPVRPV